VRAQQKAAISSLLASSIGSSCFIDINLTWRKTLSKTLGLLQQIERGKEPSVKVASSSARSSSNGSHPQPVTGEEVVKLVHSVFRSSSENVPRVVAFSGVDHGDGCTSICAGAALVLGTQFAGSLCVVDANLRSPSLHRYFGLENGSGLCEAIVQPAPIRDFTQSLGSISVLTCGSAPSSPQALLNSQNLYARIQELRDEFDYVLIDAPPIGRYSDAITLGGLTDGIVLVLQSNSTRREAALKVKEGVEAANVRLLGAVLNKRTFPIPERLYKRL